MKARTKSNLVYVFPVFLLISACMGASSGIRATLVPSPSDIPPAESTVASTPTAPPAVSAGSFDDFRLFAAEIDAALKSGDSSFFDKHVAASVWTCLGDEAFGVCKDRPADTTVEGIPVTWDWASYTVYSSENYKGMWQTRFTSHSQQHLVALANQLGDNPLMPMAGQSFLAIVSVPGSGLSFPEVRVLFFEHLENTWHLRGELVTLENEEAWLNNTCSMCYDTWEPWQE